MSIIDEALSAFESDISYIEDMIKAATRIVEKRGGSNGDYDVLGEDLGAV